MTTATRTRRHPFAEITKQGYTGGYNTLNRYLRPLRRLDAATLAELPVRMHAIRARCPELDAAVRHVARFARMIKDLSGDENTLTKWIGAVDADPPALRSFTAGLRRTTTPALSKAPSPASGN